MENNKNLYEVLIDIQNTKCKSNRDAREVIRTAIDKWLVDNNLQTYKISLKNNKIFIHDYVFSEFIEIKKKFVEPNTITFVNAKYSVRTEMEYRGDSRLSLAIQHGVSIENISKLIPDANDFSKWMDIFGSFFGILEKETACIDGGSDWKDDIKKLIQDATDRLSNISKVKVEPNSEYSEKTLSILNDIYLINSVLPYKQSNQALANSSLRHLSKTALDQEKLLVLSLFKPFNPEIQKDVTMDMIYSFTNLQSVKDYDKVISSVASYLEKLIEERNDKYGKIED